MNVDSWWLTIYLYCDCNFNVEKSETRLKAAPRSEYIARLF